MTITTKYNKEEEFKNMIDKDTHRIARTEAKTVILNINKKTSYRSNKNI